MSEYVFWFLTFVAIFSALGMILSKNPVYSVLSLIVTFFCIAGHFLLLNAQFLAAVHIIVYAGAIMVLFLYTIMMLNLNKLEEEKKSAWSKIIATVAGCMLMLVLVGIVSKSESITGIPGGTELAGMTKNMGVVLYKDFLLPFEISSVLFLAAMVGAVYLSKKELEKT